MRIDIFVMGKCIWLGTQLSCVVADQVIESGEVFQPIDLVTGELFCGHEVLKVLVIREHEYNVCRASK